MEHRGTEEVELRTSLSHVAAEVADLRHEFRTDIRRLDDRVFQLMLLQLGALATALASLVVTVLS